MSLHKIERLAREAVFTVSKILTGTNAYDEAMPLVLKSLCELMDWQSSSFWLLDENTDSLYCESFYSVQSCPNFENITRSIRFEKGRGLPGQVWQKNAPAWINDTPNDKNFPRSKYAKMDGLHAAFAFPVSTNDKVIGVFEFFSSQISEPNNEMLQAFSVVGTELGQFLERHRYAKALAKQAELNDYAAEIGNIVNRLDTLPAIMDSCARVTLRYLNLFQVHITLLGDMPTFISAGAPDDSNRGGSDFLSSVVKINQLVAEKVPYITNDITSCDKIIDAAVLTTEGVISMAAFPLVLDQVTLGLFIIFGSEPFGQTTLDACLRAVDYLTPCIARKQSEQRLIDSEKRFRIFAENVDECLFISAPQLTKHYYVSPAFEKIWGIPVAEVYADATIWAKSIVPEDFERVHEYVTRLTGAQMPEPEIEYRIKYRGGGIKWLSVKIFAVLDQLDGSYHICGSVRDVTENKNAQKRVSDFYLNVSHELRTPLTSIKGALLLLERRHAGPLSDRARAITTLARKECDRLIRLISDLLDLKKIEAGVLQLQLENIDTSEAVSQTIAMLTNLAAQKNIDLKEDICTQAKTIADRDRLTQVLTNLISNAIKFSAENSAVVVRVESSAQKIKFSVIDQGCGIRAKDQEQLFQVFQQVSNNRIKTSEGAGLGLAICKGIVVEHGGQIGVTSAEGQGSTFWFELDKSSD